MPSTRIFSILAWIALPTVMYGGYALLGMITRANTLTPFQEQYFRAGHGHAGVLLLLALLYHVFLEQTKFSPAIKTGAAVVILTGVIAQAGGFFLHMAIGQPGQASLGTTLTSVGAALLASAIAILVYGLITKRQGSGAVDI